MAMGAPDNGQGGVQARGAMAMRGGPEANFDSINHDKEIEMKGSPRI